MSSQLAEAPPRRLLQVGDEPVTRDGAPEGGPGWALGAAATAGLACLARYGYTFGTGDHLVLMPRGVADADPGAFAGDWFVDSAPQPHWLFDLITRAGETVHALPLVYLIYWLVSLAAFGVAAHWLTRRFLPGQPWSALLLGPLLVLGPEKVLGSTTPLLGIALPHVLGGCLALMALAALVNRYWSAAVLASLLAGIVHVQHGVNLAPVLVLAAVLTVGTPRRSRLALAGGAGALVVLAVIVSRWRQIESGGSEWREICETAIPFHCDANSWTGGYVLAGGLVVALALGLFWAYRSHWRELLPVVCLPAGGLALAVTADLFNVPVLGYLAQASNAYRLSALVIPFGALALLVLLTRTEGRPVQAMATVGVCMAGWALAADASLDFGSGADLVQHIAVVLGLTLAVSALPRTPAPRQTTMVVLAVLFTLVLGLDGRPPLAVGYWRGDPLIAAGVDLGATLPEGSLVVTSPANPLPTIGRQAVVADCKRVPYGGELWREHQTRVRALGGGCFGAPNGFPALTPDEVLQLARRYGGTHVLLLGSDPKTAYARDHWPLVWERSMDGPGALSAGLLVFELPAPPIS